MSWTESSVFLFAGVPMFILCYNLILAGREKPDYANDDRPTIDYQGYKIKYGE
jgi:hypothetical protein